MEWKKNLYDYQAEPPLQAWSQIKDQLDMEAPAALREQLYQLESAPPPQAWETISAGLTQVSPQQAPVKKIWYRRSWTIAAAAAVAAVVFGINYKKDDASAAAGVSTSVINPLPASPELENPQQMANSFPDADPVMTAMKNKDNNYLYFITGNGEARRLSYKLQHLLPAIRENKHHKTIDAWTEILEHSPSAPVGGSFLEMVDMVKRMETRKN